MKRLLISLCLAVLSIALAACNTTKGFAQDLQKVGGKMERAAERTGGTDR
jgi:entericidin A